MKHYRLIAVTLLSLSACSKDYSPAPQASGEQIFAAACAECHKPANNGSLYQLKPEHANLAYISEKIGKGSWLMPAFNRLSADDLLKISTYALEHSEITEK